MTLLAQAVLPLCGERPAVLEFGNQTLTADRRTLEQVIQRAERAQRDTDGLRAINALNPKARRDQTRAYYLALGAGSYTAIDVNDTYGSLVMDLNRDLQTHYGFDASYDLVTNNGTGEHVFDQGAVFRNAHTLTRCGGVMVHVMPFLNYLNHGFYSFHPNLYYALALANGYELLALGLADRDGNGIVARPPSSVGELPNFLIGGTEVPLGMLLLDAKMPRRGWPRGSVESLLARLPGASSKRRMGLRLHRLLIKGRKVLVFAVLRKSRDGDFVTPIQGRYVDDVDEHKLK